MHQVSMPKKDIKLVMYSVFKVDNLYVHKTSDVENMFLCNAKSAEIRALYNVMVNL